MTEKEMQEALKGLVAQVQAIQTDLVRLEARRGHRHHRTAIQKGVLDPATPVCPPDTIREERSPGFPFATLLRPYRNGHN